MFHNPRPSGWWPLNDLIEHLGRAKRAEIAITVTGPDGAYITDHTFYHHDFACGCRASGLIDWVRVTASCSEHAEERASA